MLRWKLTLTANICMKNVSFCFFLLFDSFFSVFGNLWEIFSHQCITVSINGLQCSSFCPRVHKADFHLVCLIFEVYRLHIVLLPTSFLPVLSASPPKHWFVANKKTNKKKTNKPRLNKVLKGFRVFNGVSLGFHSLVLVLHVFLPRGPAEANSPPPPSPSPCSILPVLMRPPDQWHHGTICCIGTGKRFFYLSSTGLNTTAYLH